MPVKQIKKTVPAKPKGIIVSFRLDSKAASALEAERNEMGVMTFSVSDSAREILMRVLKERGRL